MTRPLILASKSPQRSKLLAQAGYAFDVIPADSTAECGVCSREQPPDLVARLAYQKAKNVQQRIASGIVIGCDTVAECRGHILGKPRDRPHARKMLELLQGNPHRVYSGLCLWRRPEDDTLVKVAVTQLQMDALADNQISQYLDSGAWQGKAGAFGYQDRPGWLRITEGSESNVVGLPLELFQEMLAELSASS